MSPASLLAAIEEAERFLRAAKKAKAAIADKDSFENQNVTAAAKRASMDLSKALSAMRRRE